MNEKAFLRKYGFIVKRNFFSDPEIKELLELSEILHSNKKPKFIPLHNNKRAWGLITNNKILKNVKNFLGIDQISYLFNSHSISQNEATFVDDSWHRDNVCRLFGKGPDWKDEYNILRVAIYLNQDDESKTGLNIIKKSHNKKRYLCWLINFLRKKYKRIYFSKYFRFFFDNFVGEKIYTNPGDCIFFYANIYHSAINYNRSSKNPRKAMFLTYGTDNIHAQNFVNYYLFHRIDLPISKGIKNKDDFLQILKEKNLKIELPDYKKEIEHATY